ncbi:hypothetical protein [Megalodesulfovibrio paquesii]
MASSREPSLRKAVLMACLLVTVSAAGAMYALWPADVPMELLNEAVWRQWAERFGVLEPEVPSAVIPRTPGAPRERTVDLGLYPGVEGELDVRLAQELLRSMDAEPGLERYAVTVRIDTVRHSLTAEMLGNALIRLSGTQGGAPEQTIYKGQIRERLLAAARGGTLARP